MALLSSSNLSVGSMLQGERAPDQGPRLVLFQAVGTLQITLFGLFFPHYNMRGHNQIMSRGP